MLLDMIKNETIKMIKIKIPKTKKEISEFFKSDAFRIIILIVISTLIRVYSLSKEIFRLDEAGYPEAVFTQNLAHLIQTAGTGGWNHPVLFFIIYRAWGRIFGISQNALIALSIIFGIISIVLIYIVVKKLFKNKDVAFVSALLTCFSLFHFYFSRDASDYSFYFMMIPLSVLAFITFAENKSKDKIRNALFYLVANVALFYTHNYAFTIILFENLVFFIFIKRHKKLLKRWILLQLILLILIIPQLISLHTHATIITQGDVVDNAILEESQRVIEIPTPAKYAKEFSRQLHRIFLYNTGDLKAVIGIKRNENPLSVKVWIARVISWLLCIIIVAGIVLPLINFKKKKKAGIIDKNNLFGIALLVLLLLVPLLLTALFPWFFREKPFLFTVFIFNSLLALGIWYFFKNRFIRIILVVLIITLGVVNITHSLNNNYFFGQEEDWISLADFLKEPENQAELIVIPVNYDFYQFLYQYNFSMVDDAIKWDYYPYPLVNYSGDRYVPEPPYLKYTYKNFRIITFWIPDRPYIGQSHLDKEWYNFTFIGLNKSLQDINDFWAVYSINSLGGNYPDRPLLNLIEDNFVNVSHHEFGSARATKYKEK